MGVCDALLVIVFSVFSFIKLLIHSVKINFSINLQSPEIT